MSLRWGSGGLRYDGNSAYLRVYGSSYYVLTIIISSKKFPPLFKDLKGNVEKWSGFHCLEFLLSSNSTAAC